MSVSAPPPQQTYKPVDIEKWASGMFADEYVGQWVVVIGVTTLSVGIVTE